MPASRPPTDELLVSGDHVADVIVIEARRLGIGEMEVAHMGVMTAIDRLADQGVVSREAPEVEAITTAMANLGAHVKVAREAGRG